MWLALASMLIFTPHPINGSIVGVSRGRCPNYQFLSSNCINLTSIRTLNKVRESLRSTRSIIHAIDAKLEVQCTSSVKLAYNKYMCTSIIVNVHWVFVYAIEPSYINQSSEQEQYQCFAKRTYKCSKKTF